MRRAGSMSSMISPISWSRGRKRGLRSSARMARYGTIRRRLRKCSTYQAPVILSPRRFGGCSQSFVDSHEPAGCQCGGRHRRHEGRDLSDSPQRAAEAVAGMASQSLGSVQGFELGRNGGKKYGSGRNREKRSSSRTAASTSCTAATSCICSRRQCWDSTSSSA